MMCVTILCYIFFLHGNNEEEEKEEEEEEEECVSHCRGSLLLHPPVEA